jgi:hypothetical protein
VIAIDDELRIEVINQAPESCWGEPAGAGAAGS